MLMLISKMYLCISREIVYQSLSVRKLTQKLMSRLLFTDSSGYQFSFSLAAGSSAATLRLFDSKSQLLNPANQTNILNFYKLSLY